MNPLRFGKGKRQALPKPAPTGAGCTCKWCHRYFKDEYSFKAHLVYHYEAVNCPHCGTHRNQKQTMELSPRFDRKAGFIKRQGIYYFKTGTTYTCPKCGFAETTTQISERVNAEKGRI